MYIFKGPVTPLNPKNKVKRDRERGLESRGWRMIDYVWYREKRNEGGEKKETH